MPTCPECGTPDQRGSCDHCGAVLDSTDDIRSGDSVGGGRSGQESAAGQHGAGQQHQHGPQVKDSPGPQPGEPGPQQGGPTGPGVDPATPEDSEGGISRRKLLAGGAGAVALAGGGWYVFLRGPSGAKAVAADYVNAVNDNDWASAGSLFHGDAPAMNEMDEQGVDSYEALLEQRGVLSTYEDLEPSIDELVEYRHVPDLTEEAASDLFFQIEPGNADTIDEAKQIIALVDVDVATYYEDGSGEEHLAGDTTTVAFNPTVVSDGGDWQLWSAPRFA